MKNLDENLKIKIIIKNKNNLLANATLSLFTLEYGFITIKGFQIWISRIFNERLQASINIQPPTKIAYGKAFQQVFIEDREKWFILESKIYDKYKEINNQVESVDIDIDEVDKALSS